VNEQQLLAWFPWDALAAIATLVAACAAIWYARLTRTLAQATRDLSDTTRRAFEATNRPHLSLECTYVDAYRTSGYPALVIAVRNHGSIAAKVEERFVDPAGNYSYLTHVPFHVFPGSSAEVAYFLFLQQDAQGRRNINQKAKVTVIYRGLGETEYRTEATVESERTDLVLEEQVSTRVTIQYAS